MSREGSHQLGVLYSTLAIAFALLAQRRLAEADRCLDEVERLMGTAADRRVTAKYLLARGTWHRLRKQPRKAVDALLEARGRIHQDGAERHLGVEILYGLGLAYIDAADHDAAVGVLQDALTLSQTLGCALPAGLADLVANLTNRSVKGLQRHPA